MSRGYNQGDSINPLVVASAVAELEADTQGFLVFSGPTFNTAMRTCTMQGTLWVSGPAEAEEGREFRSRVTWGYLNKANYWAKLYWLVCDLYSQYDTGIAGVSWKK